LEGKTLKMTCVTGETKEERTLEMNEVGEVIQRFWLKEKDIAAVRTYKKN
jgi:hypothetical protein